MRRVIDLSGATSAGVAGVWQLRVDKGCLMVGRTVEEYPEEARIPLHEISVLILGHRLSLTGAVLGSVVANGGAVLSLDDSFRPAGLMVPVVGHHLVAERLRRQIERFPSVSGAFWREIVRRKIRAQAEVCGDPSLASLCERVEDGDRTNVEAQAARLYWTRLFGAEFTRGGDDARNVCLNYGYAVLRAAVARSVCAAGLHPAIGLHHRGRGDAFALASDLMEPARPIIDRVVAQLDAHVLDRKTKTALLEALLVEVELDGRRKLFEAYEPVAQSLLGDGDLKLPELVT